MSEELVKTLTLLGILILLIGVCVYALRDFHSTPDVVDLGSDTAFLPNGGKLVIYSVALKYGYEVMVNHNSVNIHALSDTQIILCNPDCTVTYRDWPLTWTFEKVEGGVIVHYPSLFYLID